MLLVLNKLIILGDILEQGEFIVTPQFIAMFPIFFLEIILIYKLNNPIKEQVNFWTGVLLFYGVIVLVVLISLELKYLGNWSRSGFNELLFELTLTLFFFMRNIFLRHYVITYAMYLLITIGFIIYYRKNIAHYQTL